MTYPLFSRVALSEDFPEYRLYRGDVATIVDIHEAEDNEETGYSIEVFNAIGDTIALLVVEESKIKPLKSNEILHIRQIGEVAVI
jgi:hypothetical protein